MLDINTNVKVTENYGDPDYVGKTGKITTLPTYNQRCFGVRMDDDSLHDNWDVFLFYAEELEEIL